MTVSVETIRWLYDQAAAGNSELSENGDFTYHKDFYEAEAHSKNMNAVASYLELPESWELRNNKLPGKKGYWVVRVPKELQQTG